MEEKRFHPGDSGLTNTFSRKQISKADPLFEIIGALEEGAAHLGIAKAQASGDLAQDISKVQSALLRAVSFLSGKKEAFTSGCVKAVEEMLSCYEAQGYGKETKAEKPAENLCAGHLELARSIVRRAERKAFSYSQRAYIDKSFLAYLNRISDLLFGMEKKAYEATHSSQMQTYHQVEEIVRRTVHNIVPESLPLVNLQIAKELAAEIEQKAAAMGLQVVVAIVEKGGNLVLLESMDEAYLASVKTAWDKAYTAVALKMPTETVGKMAAPGGALEGLIPTAENRISFLGGGIPLKIGTELVGGLGVSGGSAQQDISLAQFGAELFERRT